MWGSRSGWIVFVYSETARNRHVAKDLTHSTFQLMNLKHIRRIFHRSYRLGITERAPETTPSISHPVGYQTLSEGTKPIVAE